MSLRWGILASVVCAWLVSPRLLVAQPQPIRHAVLIAGEFTGIIDEEGREVWSTSGGAKDATRLANGHILITYTDEVVEFDAEKEIVWRFPKLDSDAELVSAWRLDSGETMIVVLGDDPRLIEVNTAGELTSAIPLDPEQTDNHHMQTRMARPLANGNYIAPHLWGFSVRILTRGTIVADCVMPNTRRSRYGIALHRDSN